MKTSSMIRTLLAGSLIGVAAVAYGADTSTDTSTSPTTRPCMNGGQNCPGAGMGNGMDMGQGMGPGMGPGMGQGMGPGMGMQHGPGMMGDQMGQARLGMMKSRMAQLQKTVDALKAAKTDHEKVLLLQEHLEQQIAHMQAMMQMMETLQNNRQGGESSP